ncbi:hypothetical protein K474DRAFT_1660144 [Panus rudis PR-1116 ss-1]|nr:hypothetical protein K474DRAFT_1660144 [Panus rudis PR-1116 ss-1]
MTFLCFFTLCLGEGLPCPLPSTSTNALPALNHGNLAASDALPVPTKMMLIATQARASPDTTPSVIMIFVLFSTEVIIPESSAEVDKVDIGDGGRTGIGDEKD